MSQAGFWLRGLTTDEQQTVRFLLRAGTIRPAFPGPTLKISVGQTVAWPAALLGWAQVESLLTVHVQLIYRTCAKRHCGVTQTSEQYTGFKALAGPLHHMPTMTLDETAAFVASQAAPLVNHITDPDLRVKVRAAGASAVLRDLEMHNQLYRLAPKQLHPDGNRGNTTAAANWERRAEAKKVPDRDHTLGGATIAG